MFQVTDVSWMNDVEVAITEHTLLLPKQIWQIVNVGEKFQIFCSGDTCSQLLMNRLLKEPLLPSVHFPKNFFWFWI